MAAVEFKTEKPEISLTMDGRGKATFLCPKNKLQVLDGLKTGEYVLELKRYRERRSLDANAYAWVLINAIADEIQSSKDEVYLEMLKSYGQSATATLKATVEPSDFFKYYECIREAVANGVLYKHYRVYKGSSHFDTKEMSVFIEGLVYEAKELGIDTRTPEEIALMAEEWGNEKHTSKG